MFEEKVYHSIQNELNGTVKLCAVSKKHSIEEIRTAYDLGQRIFGENKAAELVQKATALPDDIEWHFIGHLQRNKVKQILPYVSCIQSLDSIRLAEMIEKEAAAVNRTVDCLLEFHLAESDTNKTGLLPEEAGPMLEACAKLPHVHLVGMMTMGPHTEDEAAIRRVFENGYSLFQTLQAQNPAIQTLSMGMSDDYRLAIEAGANMVRIGSKLFEG